MLIKELFSEYTDNIPNPVGRGELLKICHSKDGKQMVLFAKFTQLQRFDNLDEFERAAAKAVGLDYLRADILPICWTQNTRARLSSV